MPDIKEVLRALLGVKGGDDMPPLPGSPKRSMNAPASARTRMNPKNADQFSHPGGEGTVAPYLPSQHLADIAADPAEAIEKRYRQFEAERRAHERGHKHRQ